MLLYLMLLVNNLARIRFNLQQQCFKDAHTEKWRKLFITTHMFTLKNDQNYLKQHIYLRKEPLIWYWWILYLLRISKYTINIRFRKIFSSIFSFSVLYQALYFCWDAELPIQMRRHFHILSGNYPRKSLSILNLNLDQKIHICGRYKTKPIVKYLSLLLSHLVQVYIPQVKHYLDLFLYRLIFATTTSVTKAKNPRIAPPAAT